MMFLSSHAPSGYYSRRDSDTPDTPCDIFRGVVMIICFLFILPINIMLMGIRYYTRVDAASYSEPCNITDLIPLSYLRSLHHQKNGYERILEKDTWKNQVGGKRISEIETARQQKEAIVQQIKVQTEYRQKCAGINIRQDQINIMETALFWAIWLFRIGSTLFFIYGYILYKYFQIVQKFPFLSILPFDLIVACFISSGISLSDYFFIKNFDEKLINFEECFSCI